MQSASIPDEAAGDLVPGVVVGEYRIEHKLKQGGMGTVYAAVHELIHKRAAVKVLKRELCENEETVHRFLQEARAVNRIGHPNIVDVFGFGTTSDGRSFLAMELLVGETLGERFARGPVRRTEACDVVTEITYALEAAHGCGIIHRDLKPENVFLAEARGGVVVKLLDFGIAKLTGGGGLTGAVDVTQPGTVIGTPKYIAPEQARGLPVDGSADVYALGVILFELMTGRPPFIGSDPVELIAKHVALAPPRPSDLDPTLPAVADTLLGAMLAKEPRVRPSLPHVRQLLADIRAMPEVETSIAASRGPATTILSAFDAPAAPPPRHRRLRWLVLPAALAVLAIGVRGAVWIADGRAAAPVSADPPANAEATLTVMPIAPSVTARPPHAEQPPGAEQQHQATQPPMPPPSNAAPRPSHEQSAMHASNHHPPTSTATPTHAAAPPHPADLPTAARDDAKPPPPPDDDALRDPFHH